MINTLAPTSLCFNALSIVLPRDILQIRLR
jgi:hypothetical protein